MVCLDDLTQREKWAIIMTVFKSIPMAKSMPRKNRQALQEYLRRKLCPDVSLDEWLVIENNIVSFKDEVLKTLTTGFYQAIGQKLPEKDESELLKELEENSGFSSEHIEALENILPKDHPVYDMVQKLKKEKEKM